MAKTPSTATDRNINEPVMFAPKVRSNLSQVQNSTPRAIPVAAQNVTYEHNPFRPEIYRTTGGYLQ